MKTNDRRIAESPLYQGEDEEVIYNIRATPWGSSPTNISVVVKDSGGSDVTSTVTTGSASVVGDVITLPKIHSLTDGEDYRVEVKFTVSGNVFEAWTALTGQQ